MNPPGLHPNVAHLECLLGTWRGRGTGVYPTIEEFDYVEEVVFDHVGKPFISYSQKTRNADTDLPLHSESGYLRPIGSGGLEFVVAQPTGIVELHEGAFTATDSGGVFELTSTSVPTTATAVEVDRVHRVIEVDGGSMTYHLDMAAAGQVFQRHLTAELRRAE